MRLLYPAPPGLLSAPQRAKDRSAAATQHAMALSIHSGSGTRPSYTSWRDAITARLPTNRQQWVNDHCPDATVSHLKLLATGHRNPNGTRVITAFSLSVHRHTWVTGVSVLKTVEGTEFEKARVIRYIYRYTPTLKETPTMGCLLMCSVN